MARGIPFTLVDLSNGIIITSTQIPIGDIEDDRDIRLNETKVPGLGYDVVTPAGSGNRKFKFKIDLTNRRSLAGNVVIINQLLNLRNAVVSITDFFPGEQFNKNPKVLYSWGTGSPPLECFVKAVKLKHRADMVNEASVPQYTSAELELWKDEESLLNIAEDAFRLATARAGTLINVGTAIAPNDPTKKPY